MFSLNLNASAIQGIQVYPAGKEAVFSFQFLELELSKANRSWSL